MRADVSNEDDARAMVQHAVATYGRVDALYNNAGIMPEADHSVVDTDVDTWDRVMADQRPGRVPGLQVRDPGDARPGLRLDHQHRELRRDPRLLRAPGRVHGLEGRGARADAVDGRAVRGARRPHERDQPGPDRDADADGLAAQGRGRQAAPAGPQPDRAVRQARGDRERRDLPRVGRVALDERRKLRGRRRASRSTTSSGAGRRRRAWRGDGRGRRRATRGRARWTTEPVEAGGRGGRGGGRGDRGRDRRPRTTRTRRPPRPARRSTRGPPARGRRRRRRERDQGARSSTSTPASSSRRATASRRPSRRRRRP